MKTIQSNDYSHIEKWKNESGIKPHIYVSIIIPFYSGAVYLERTLTSLMDQSYPMNLYEIIIVQDVGGEDIDGIIRDINKIFKLKLIKISHTGFTPARSRNIGIKNASGEIIISIDFDIICPNRFVESHMKWYHISKDLATFGLRKFIDASTIKPENVNESREILECNSPSIESISNTRCGALFDKRIDEIKMIKQHPFPFNCFHGCNISYPKKYALEVGYWDENFDYNYGYEDIDFGCRLWKRGLYIVYEPNALALHQENTILTKQKKIEGLEINRKLLYQKVPELKGFRESKNAEELYDKG